MELQTFKDASYSHDNCEPLYNIHYVMDFQT